MNTVRRKTVLSSPTRAGLSLIILAFALNANAGPFQYECEVKQVFDVDGGELRPVTKDIRVGQRFTISRESGEIVGGGAYALYRRQGWKAFDVLDRGSKAQSFKLLTVSQGPFTTITLVTVKEYEEEEQKTFIYYDNFSVSTGLCR
jgi:hypothetical protein